MLRARGAPMAMYELRPAHAKPWTAMPHAAVPGAPAQVTAWFLVWAEDPDIYNWGRYPAQSSMQTKPGVKKTLTKIPATMHTIRFFYVVPVRHCALGLPGMANCNGRPCQCLASLTGELEELFLCGMTGAQFCSRSRSRGGPAGSAAQGRRHQG
jgi:hypothetical protein